MQNISNTISTKEIQKLIKKISLKNDDLKLQKNDIEYEYNYDIELTNYICHLDITYLQNTFNSLSEFIFDKKYLIKINYYHFEKIPYIRLFIQDRINKTKEEDLKNDIYHNQKLIKNIENLIKISFFLAIYKFKLLLELDKKDFEKRSLLYNENIIYKENNIIKDEFNIDFNDEINNILKIDKNNNIKNEFQKYIKLD
jgi:hypothetical protein